MNDLYIQYGCCLSCPEGWENFDSSPTLRLQRIPLFGRFFRRKGFEPFPARVRYGDIIRGLPIAEGSCKGVYCSHVLEHLAIEDARTAMRNTYKCLAPGGTFRLVLPDLQRYIQEYVDSDSDTPSLDFLAASLLGKKTRRRGIKAVLHTMFSGADHLSMWDERSMAHELKEAGFSNIRRAQIGDSRDEHFAVVEDEQRWNGHLGMECTKP